jgi:hypothetical protein
MSTFIVAIIIGVVCIVIGMFNINGHIGTLKRKHRKRVTAEDLPVFSKLIGIGTIIIGVALFLFGVFACVQFFTGKMLFDYVGKAVLIVGLAVGGIISIFAMIKYNKGIF